MGIERLAVVLAAGFVLAGCGTQPQGSKAEPASSPTPPAACSTADGLIAEGKLDAAQKMLDDVKSKTPDACLESRTKLVDQRALAAAAAKKGDDAKAAQDTATARVHYLAAVALDMNNTSAVNGLAEFAAPKPALTSASDQWDKFVTDWIEPIGRLLGAVLAVLLVLLVIARVRNWLLPALAPRSARFRTVVAWIGGLLTMLAVVIAVTAAAWPKHFRWWEFVALGLAVAGGVAAVWATFLAYRWRPFAQFLCVAGVAVVVAGLALGVFGLTAHWPGAVALLVATLAGGHLFTWGTGSALKLHIEVKQEEKAHEAAAALVSGILRRLGTTAPEGLRTSYGADVTTLPSDAIAEAPEGKFAAVIVKLVRAILPTSPWGARVCIYDVHRGTVSITRNSRLVEDIPLDRRGWWPDAPKPDTSKGSTQTSTQTTSAESEVHADLYPMAAAAILLTLSRHYPTLQPGLCGATTWESVACQVLANEPNIKDPLVSRTLLLRATDVDPDNLLAQQAMVNVLFADAKPTKKSELDYANRLAVLQNKISNDEGEDKGREALRLRLLYSRAAALHNASLLPPTDSDDDSGKAVVDDLVTWIEDYEKRGDTKLNEYIKSLKPAAGWLRRMIYAALPGTTTPDNVGAWTVATTADANYQKACFLAESYDAQDADLAEIVDLLRAGGVEREDVRRWARWDPSFQKVAGLDDFRELVGIAPPARLIDLEPFAGHATMLAQLGAATPERLLQLTEPTNIDQLKEATGAPLLMINRWRDIATLLAAIGSDPGQDNIAPARRQKRALARLDLLIKAGIGSRSAIPASEFQRKPFVERLAELADDAIVAAPDDADLRRWRADQAG